MRRRSSNSSLGAPPRPAPLEAGRCGPPCPWARLPCSGCKSTTSPGSHACPAGGGCMFLSYRLASGTRDPPHNLLCGRLTEGAGGHSQVWHRFLGAGAVPGLAAPSLLMPPTHARAPAAPPCPPSPQPPPPPPSIVIEAIGWAGNLRLGQVAGSSPHAPLLVISSQSGARCKGIYATSHAPTARSLPSGIVCGTAPATNNVNGALATGGRWSNSIPPLPADAGTQSHARGRSCRPVRVQVGGNERFPLTCLAAGAGGLLDWGRTEHRSRALASVWF